MKNLLITIIAVLLQSATIFAQEEIIDPIEQSPKFPGGLDSLWCFIERNLRSDIVNSDTESIRYVFKFVIDSSGVAKNFIFLTKLPRGLITKNDSLKEIEILRVLCLMPRWEPAKQDNMGISCWFTLPINTPIKDYKSKRVKSSSK